MKLGHVIHEWMDPEAFPQVTKKIDLNFLPRKFLRKSNDDTLKCGNLVISFKSCGTRVLL